MKEIYDKRITHYYCERCGTPIDVESDILYEFISIDDSNFWCQSCEDLPRAQLWGIPAKELPQELVLHKGFICRTVPLAEPGDIKNSNILYRPFTTRSFLRQYIDWLRINGDRNVCELRSEVSVGANFDAERQEYTQQLTHTIIDTCGEKTCEFLQMRAVKPTKIECQILNKLCEIKGAYGLCDTVDEAILLKHYLSLNGSQHFPMLVPQPSLMKGKKRPDFLCFVPLSKFQYQKIAVLVDRLDKDVEVVKQENHLYEYHGFTVRRVIIVPETKNHFREARKLSNWIETLPHGGNRPHLNSSQKSIKNPITWVKVLLEDTQLRDEIQKERFGKGTFGKFLQDGLREFGDMID